MNHWLITFNLLNLSGLLSYPAPHSPGVSNQQGVFIIIDAWLIDELVFHFALIYWYCVAKTYSSQSIMHVYPTDHFTHSGWHNLQTSTCKNDQLCGVYRYHVGLKWLIVTCKWMTWFLRILPYISISLNFDSPFGRIYKHDHV